MRSRRQRWAGLVLAGVLSLVGCRRMSPSPGEAEGARTVEPVPVRLAAIEHRTVERTVDVVGSLHGWEEVTVGAKRVGRVARVAHDIGDRVKPGDLLIQLETTDAELAVRQARQRLLAELAKLGLRKMPGKDFDLEKVPSVVKARLGMERAELALGREQSLFRKKVGTMEIFQNAENDKKAAAAALDTARLAAEADLASARSSEVALEVAEQQLKDMEIRAPELTALPPEAGKAVVFAVARRRVTEGQMVKESDPVVELVIENPLRLRANVPERHSGEVRAGQAVKLRVASGPREFVGTVTRVSPAVDPVSRSFQVEAMVPNPDRRLRPGGFAKVQIVTQVESDATIVPIEAVLNERGVTKLFVVHDGKAHEIQVATVPTPLEGRGLVEVAGPIPTRGEVVIDGQTKLFEGCPVVVQTAEAASSTEKQSDRGAPLPDVSRRPGGPGADASRLPKAALRKSPGERGA